MDDGGRDRSHDIALRLLARRDLSTSRLRERLLRRGLPADDIERAIARLTRAGLLDDARTAEAHARRAVYVKLRGRRRAEQELRALGIDAQTAGRALAAVFAEVDETALLKRAIDRRAEGPIRTRAEFRRLHQALVRQGFPPDETAAALLALTRGDGAFMEE